MTLTPASPPASLPNSTSTAKPSLLALSTYGLAMLMFSSSVSKCEQSIMMLSSAVPCCAQSSARVMSSSLAAWSRCTAIGTEAA